MTPRCGLIHMGERVSWGDLAIPQRQYHMSQPGALLRLQKIMNCEGNPFYPSLSVRSRREAAATAVQAAATQSSREHLAVGRHEDRARRV